MLDPLVWWNCTLAGNLCVIHHSWWNNHLHLWSLDCTNIAQCFCEKGNATNPNTWVLFSINFEICTDYSLWRLSWCRIRHTWRWVSRIMSSPRMSSRNHSPNFCFIEGFFPSLQLDLFLGCIDIGLLLLPLLLFEEAGFYPHREGNGFPIHAWRFIFVSTSFESSEPYSWFSTVGLEDSKHTLSKFSSFCATMNRNCPYSCFHRSPLWCLCTGPRWCIGWGYFSPFASAASEEFSTLEIVLLTFTRR